MCIRDSLTTPRDWLGQRFFDDAEFVKKTKPTSYRHEYLGEAVGNGTQVFDNIRLESITKAQINSFNAVSYTHLDVYKRQGGTTVDH